MTLDITDERQLNEIAADPDDPDLEIVRMTKPLGKPVAGAGGE